LNPLVALPDAPLDARLLGAWNSGETTWTFERESDKDVFGGREFFKVTLAKDGESAGLIAWIGTVGETKFIDFFPDMDSVHLPIDLFKTHVIGAHTFGRVRIDTDRVS